jgi:hypothetical protein
MTTRSPYGPTPPPSGADYPTAPPWAAAQHGPVAAPTPPFVPYGGLMVPYPEELFNAGRPKAPSWVPVVLFTLLFGPLALISVIRRAAKARRERNDQYPYWIAFAAAFAFSLVLSGIAVAIAVPALIAARERAVTTAVQRNLVHDGQLPAGRTVTVSSANCTPTAVRPASGLRPYSCLVTLTDGRTATVAVLADSDGHLRTVK